MNHTWDKLPDTDEVHARYKNWKCKVCGCVKTLGRYKFATPLYYRGSRISEGYLECIDMEAENLKTID